MNDGVLTKINKTSIGQLNDLIPMLFPGLIKNAYYDVHSELKMVNMSYVDESYNDESIPFDETALSSLRIAIYKKLPSIGYTGEFTKDTVADELNLLCMGHPRNLWREWLESLKWDGQPRVRNWFQVVCGAKTPGLTREEDKQYLGDVITAWAVGCVARQYGSIQTDVLPLLIGTQRIGKSNFYRFMAHEDRWFADVGSDMSNPRAFLESIRGAVIVELSESTAIRSKESEKTKAFVSKRTDIVRRPYDREVTISNRKWVLCASSNLATPFTDITGNARYFPIYCNDCEDNLIKKFFDDNEFADREVTQFWAEIMEMYRNGATPFLSMSTKALSCKVQTGASAHNEAVEFLNDYLDSSEEYSKAGAFITRAEIENIFNQQGSNTLSNEVFKSSGDFFFKWLNSEGCAWVKDRIRRKRNGLEGMDRIRGFTRKTDAEISD